MRMNQEDFSNMVLQTMINLQAELVAVKSFIADDYIERNLMTEDEFQKMYSEQVDKAKEIIVAKKKIRYGDDFNVDDILTGILN